MLDIKLEKISKELKARVGVYSVGLRAYWSQFQGLRERCEGYGCFVSNKLAQFGTVSNFGLVDDETKGRQAGEYFNANNVDIIFCLSTTYVTSSVILPIHRICTKPVIILNLQPALKMNYEKTDTSEWLAHCGACPIPEFSNMFNRAKINFKVINGLLGLAKTPDTSVANEVTKDHPLAISSWKEIKEWVRAASVVRTLQFSNMGFLGNTYSGMLDLYSDITMIQAQTGLHISILEMCDLHHYFEKVTAEEISNKLKEIKLFFEKSEDSSTDSIAKKPTLEQLDLSAKVAIAQEKMVREKNIDALTYYYHGLDNNLYEKYKGALF